MGSSHRCSRLPVLYAPERELGGGKGVGKRYLVSRLNFINFSGGRILLAARGPNGEALLPAQPYPCAGEVLRVRWLSRDGGDPSDHTPVGELLVPDGGALLVAKGEVLSCDRRGAALLLPETCRSCRGRETRRERGDRVAACCSQEGVLFRGKVADFSPEGVRVEGRPPAGFNVGLPVHLMLEKDGELLFSASARIQREERGALVLRSTRERVIKYPPVRHREPRRVLSPAPMVTLRHPLSGKRVTLLVEELSGTGFSVRTRADDPLLVPGLIFAEVGIVVGAFPPIACRAQLLSRGRDPGGRGIRCAFAILDMSPLDQERLLALLPQEDSTTFTEGELDTASLWELLFDTGFVYPDKYLLLQRDRAEVQRTFRSVYAGHPEIARCFTCRDATGLLGHLAMLRFYREAWLIHHHAARRTLTVRAGLAVLTRAAHHLNALHRLPAAHLRHVFCYFRPENKLPSRVFGGGARHLDDQGCCSLDRFAYGLYERGAAEALPAGWHVERARGADLERLAGFYREHSGGLLPRAFDLCEEPGDDDLPRAYRRAGIFRKRRLYALRREGETVAFAMAERSDAGLNLSELTDCVTLFLFESLPADVLEAFLARLSVRYREHRMPVLVYPHQQGKEAPLAHRKEYLLWILDLEHADRYLDYFDLLVQGPGKRGRAGKPEPPWETRR